MIAIRRIIIIATITTSGVRRRKLSNVFWESVLNSRCIIHWSGLRISESMKLKVEIVKDTMMNEYRTWPLNVVGW